MKFIDTIPALCRRLPRAVLTTALALPLFTHAQYCPPMSSDPAPNPNLLLQSSFEKPSVESNREWIDPSTCTERLPVSIRGTKTLVDTPSDCDYYVAINTIVSGELIIEPGVTVVFGAVSDLIFRDYGKLTAKGTPDQRIQFLGEDDKDGFWGGVTFYNQTVAVIENVDIRNAGNVCGAAFCPSGGLIVQQDASLTMTDSTIAGAADRVNGMVIDGSVDIKSFERNRFCDNPIGLLVNPKQIPNLSVSNNYSYANNPNDSPYVLVGNFFDLRGFHWPKLDTPYFVDSIGFKSGTVTFEPGTEVVVDLRFKISEHARIQSIGTPDEPVTFRGATSEPGSWYAIDLQFTRKDNRFEHTIFDYSFHALNVFGSSVSLDNVVIKNTQEEGIDCSSTNNDYVYQRNVTFENIGGGNFDNYAEDCIVRPLR